MDFLDAYLRYKKIQELVNDNKFIVGFETKNGKRIIVKTENGLCVPINNRFKIVSHLDEKNLTYYDNPLHLFETYTEEFLKDEGVCIKNAVLFLHNQLPILYKWLNDDTLTESERQEIESNENSM